MLEKNMLLENTAKDFEELTNLFGKWNQAHRALLIHYINLDNVNVSQKDEINNLKKMLDDTENRIKDWSLKCESLEAQNTMLLSKNNELEKLISELNAKLLNQNSENVYMEKIQKFIEDNKEYLLMYQPSSILVNLLLHEDIDHTQKENKVLPLKNDESKIDDTETPINLLDKKNDQHNDQFEQIFSKLLKNDNTKILFNIGKNCCEDSSSMIKQNIENTDSKIDTPLQTNDKKEKNQYEIYSHADMLNILGDLYSYIYTQIAENEILLPYGIEYRTDVLAKIMNLCTHKFLENITYKEFYEQIEQAILSSPFSSFEKKNDIDNETREKILVLRKNIIISLIKILKEIF